MKKLIAIVSLLLLAPFTAFGLTAIPESQMSDITAQAGVSIAADVRLQLDIDTIAWGDSDGIGGTSTGGWVGVSDVNASLFYGLRSDAGAGFDITAVEVLTIDVATDANMYNGASFVRIGLGTFELSGDINADIELGATTGLGQELGTLDILGLEILGGAGSYVDITTMGRASGVTLMLNVLLDEVNIGSLAWGDTDGLNHVYGAASSAGYVGLANVDIDNLAVTGALGIDTATMDYGQIMTDYMSGAFVPGTNAEGVLVKLAGYMANNIGEISDTLVVLSLGNADGTTDASTGDINVSIGSLTADVAIGSDSDLRNGDVMGSLYIGNANITVDGIVAIGAH